MTKLFLSFLTSLITLQAMAQVPSSDNLPLRWGDWQEWGWQKDGTYLNPVLPADFSDIDCIEHDGWYYAISSSFQFSPGMVILRSSDLVDWEIYSHAVPDITQIGPALNYDVMDRYARGIWAGAIRWHDGLFYIYFGCPDEGMFMTTARRIEGPWAPLHKMNIDGGWDDPCPLFDEDGNNYFVASHFADNYKTYVFRMDKGGKTVDWDSKVLVNEGAGREANKLYKFGGRYYHLFSEVNNEGRYLMIQRSDGPMGPYSEKHQMADVQRDWHEPNQGGFLQNKKGEWFFLTHHGSGDWGGRIASLMPVKWEDGWPEIQSFRNDRSGYLKSSVLGKRKGSGSERHSVTAFTSPYWEWNYQPRRGFYSLSKNRLVLKAFRPLEKDNVMKAGNTLTLRSWQTGRNEVVVRMDVSRMADGQKAGLCHFSSAWSEFGVRKASGNLSIYYQSNSSGLRSSSLQVPSLQSPVFLRSTWSLDGRCHYSYSLDGREFKDLGIVYQMEWGNYRGDRLGLFTYNNDGEAGEVTFDRFSYEVGKELPVLNPFGKALVPDMIADASIIHHDGTFYCYATTDGYGQGLRTSGPPTVWKSRDFVNWSFDGNYYPQASKEVYWAPSKAVERNGKWYIYPTVNSYMYPSVADSPEGPFRLAKGDGFTVENRLWVKDKVHAIDTEIFIDDDGQAYAFWGSRNVARLHDDMMTIDSLVTLETRRKEYSEGPIFFKRKGIYYYLYTIGGDENYEYYYQMSRVSPTGPFVTPEHDLVCTTDINTGVFGPGHGCVFNVEGTDDWYLAFLEFGRNSTNRQTYVNRLTFNPDGTINQVKVTMDGVGFLSPSTMPGLLSPKSVSASSVMRPERIRYFNDWRCQRTELFVPEFALDGENGSRWMACDDDSEPSLTLDMGAVIDKAVSHIYFVRPTQGHAYTLSSSLDGKTWTPLAQHQLTRKSPHTDSVNRPFQYLKVTITEGLKGIWEWKVTSE